MSIKEKIKASLSKDKKTIRVEIALEIFEHTLANYSANESLANNILQMASEKYLEENYSDMVKSIDSDTLIKALLLARNTK